MNPLKTFVEALDRVRIPYLIGGSHASSARGEIRTTRDVDVVAAIQPAQADLLAAALGKDWYAEPDQMRDAIVRGRSFNIIYMPSVEKFDVFPAADEFQIAQLERATVENIPFAGQIVSCKVATAEDILLAKLRWYQAGGGVSEQQWRDISGIIALNSSLDMPYLNTWAARLNVTDLLARALRETRD
jgi:hypothetical protein